MAITTPVWSPGKAYSMVPRHGLQCGSGEAYSVAQARPTVRQRRGLQCSPGNAYSKAQARPRVWSPGKAYSLVPRQGLQCVSGEAYSVAQARPIVLTRSGLE